MNKQKELALDVLEDFLEMLEDRKYNGVQFDTPIEAIQFAFECGKIHFHKNRLRECISLIKQEEN